MTTFPTSSAFASDALAPYLPQMFGASIAGTLLVIFAVLAIRSNDKAGMA